MFINYLVIAFSNLTKYKIFSIINVTGMDLVPADCIFQSIRAASADPVKNFAYNS